MDKLDNMNHAFDLSLKVNAQDELLVEEMSAEVQAFSCAGTFGCAGSFGGTAGSFGTFGCASI
ncbi:thiocillin family RiPP [Teredinibacter sp. KSP-S5-2]|uniref:thiocillin family RiPP n=1 Tax=Teredinibacter sp. KSP-S5-2 TaxID=3034506 RepID=UPI002934DD16|nr:thiocillin family RiPP [Teredinibacter sp. KSP-S5-2]WNO11292.1 thiocillin family RiPP [Teredinibacter sp. KSP-S5-2]